MRRLVALSFALLASICLSQDAADPWSKSEFLEPAALAAVGDMAGDTDIAPIDVTASRDLATLRPSQEPPAQDLFVTGAS